MIITLKSARNKSAGEDYSDEEILPNVPTLSKEYLN